MQEDDKDMFTSLLLYSSIYTQDETSEVVVFTIENILQEKGQLFGTWIYTHCSSFGASGALNSTCR